MSIEEYLAVLRRNLRTGPLARRRIMREIEAHVLEAAREEEMGGVARDEAERRALARFGSAEELAARFSEPNDRGARRRKAALVLAVGALAIGVTLGLALSRGGHQIRVAVPPGVTISFGSTMVHVVPGRKAGVTRDPRMMAFDANGNHVPSVEAFLNETRKSGRHIAFVKEGSKEWLVSRGRSGSSPDNH